MNIIIKQNELGYLMKNGQFVKILTSGKYKIYSFLGQSIIKVSSIGIVDAKEIPIDILKEDEFFKNNTVHNEASNTILTLHYINHLFADAILNEEHYYWNLFEKHSFQYIDMKQIYFNNEFPVKLFSYIPKEYYVDIDVESGEAVLLYLNGKFEKILSCGTHYLWNTVPVSYKIYDLKAQQLEISGQEILTADKVSVRLSFILNFKIVDPVKISEEIKNLNNQLYQFVQLILREYIGKYNLDELLNQKNEISQYISKKLKENEKRFYVEFLESGIRDIILPGNIRDIMNTVLIAEKTAQANVISRREEVASTRSLLNTAKLMDENTTLYKLKELEYIERICDKVGSISLSSSNSNMIAQLSELLCSKKEITKS